MIIDPIKRYLDAGWSLVPLMPNRKNPDDKGWQSKTYAIEDFPEGVNVGAKCGEVSGWRVDVDLDVPEAIQAADALLPNTGLVHGRPGKPRSHRWFIVPGAQSKTYKDLDGTMLLELRASGQTMIPASVHPSGERVRWYSNGEPMKMDVDGWTEAGDIVAIATVLARHWPTGSRHLAAGAVAGFLARLDIEPRVVEEIVKTAATIARDEEVQDRVRFAAETAAKAAKGDITTGGPKMSEYFEDGAKLVALISRWLGRSEPSEFPNTEDGDARFFAHRNADRVRFDHRRGRWLLLSENGLWVPDQVQRVTRLVADAMRERQQIANGIQDSKERAVSWNWAHKGESRSRISNTIALAQSIAPIADAGDEWDTDPWLLGVPNGVVDLRTGQLRQARPEDRITLSAGVEYEIGATSALWTGALRDIFVDDALVDFFQTAAGYAATGDTRRDCWFLSSGGGRNGKGTLYNAIRRALGDYALELPAAIFDRRRDTASYDLALVPGKRFVTSSESGDTIHLNHDRIKQLTGGDPIRAANKYEKSFEFDPTCKLWLACNKKPRVTDDTVGFWERVFLIPFTQSFVGRENRDLRPALEHDPVHQRAVLAWIVAGAQRYYAKGLEPPAAVKAATQQYRKDSSPLTDFLDECCLVQEGAQVQSSMLFKAYQRWASGNGVRYPLTLKSFGLEVKAQFEHRSIKGAIWYEGVGLVDAQLAAPEDAAGLYGDSPF